MNAEKLDSWMPRKPGQVPAFPHVIAGPCAAETQEQTLQTALRLAKDPRVTAIRAGVWKPRTRPGSFEGVGEKALPWLQEVQKLTHLPIAIEVGNALHVEKALEAGIDILWIGAKTTVNPFSVQEIADALQGVDVPVMIKNPANPDINLWIGALERVQKAGISRLAVVHRGFSTYESIPYRHDPLWAIPIEFRRRFPEIPMICDPSHITGKWELLEEISQKGLDLAMDGLMIESHTTPREAWSDARQQLTPEDFSALLDRLQIRASAGHETQSIEPSLASLDLLRQELDQTDEAIIRLLASRMQTVAAIGALKKEHNMAILQIKRWDAVIRHLMLEGERLGLPEAVVKRLYDLIHQASISVQEDVFAQKERTA